jgi:hypothetical protein
VLPIPSAFFLLFFSSFAGHYYSYIRDNKADDSANDDEDPFSDNAKWYEFNDTIVRPFDIKNELRAACFGGKETYEVYDNSTGQYVQRGLLSLLLILFFFLCNK